MHSKTAKRTAKQMLAGAIAALVLLGSTSLASAQAARPKWSGRLSARPSSFETFMRRHIGKNVDLNIIFDSPRQAGKNLSGAEPHTSLGGDTGPIFQVGGSVYLVQNGGNERTWRTLMGYDKDRRQLVGTFTVMSGRKSAEDPGYNFDLRWRPNFKRDIKVFAVSEKGRILLRTSGITLRGGHIQVPVAVYKELGFDMRRDIDNGKVSLGTPERFNEPGPDTTTFDIDYSPPTYRRPPDNSQQKLFEDFRPPTVLLQNGEFFLPPSLIQRRFDGKISTKWDALNRTLTVRRTQKFADFLTNLYSHT